MSAESRGEMTVHVTPRGRVRWRTWMGLAALVLALVGAGWIYLEPIAFYRGLTRIQLSFSGLDKEVIWTPRGRLVFFEGGGDEADTRPQTWVLVHGLGDHAGTWSKIVAELGRRHRLLVPDLPGHGASGPDQGPLTFELELEALRTLIDERAPGEKVVLVGNSMGGWLAAVYALEHPDRLRHLVLVDAAGLTLDLGGVNLLPKNRDEADILVRALLGPRYPWMPSFILSDLTGRVWRGPIPRIAKSLSDPKHLLAGRLGALEPPTDLIWGGGDGLFPRTIAERFQQELPNAELVVLPGCGHVPQALCPGEFVETLEGLVGGMSPKPEPSIL